jgi:hypothetical protein
MKQCSGIKANGGRCERIVGKEQDYCYGHDPARQSERRRNAAREGRGKATGEIGRVKAHLQALAEATLSGEVDTRVAAVTSQVWNTYLAAVRTGLKVREIEELEARLEDLEAALQHQKETRRYGA